MKHGICRFNDRTLVHRRGIAAVELAIMLPIFLILLAFPLYFGRFFMHYRVANDAAQDAARYLSTVPMNEIKNPALIAQVVAVANEIIRQETSELNPGVYASVTTVLCDGLFCNGFSVPSVVTVGVSMQMDDIFFSNSTALSIPINARADYPYVGK